MPYGVPSQSADTGTDGSACQWRTRLVADDGPGQRPQQGPAAGIGGSAITGIGIVGASGQNQAAHQPQKKKTALHEKIPLSLSLKSFHPLVPQGFRIVIGEYNWLLQDLLKASPLFWSSAT